MFLIGQYDSPFVRRVAIALYRYGLPFRHEQWSAFGDADLLRHHNPLTRVPTLVLDDGESLIDSGAILDYLDGLMPPDRRLFPVAQPQRRRALYRAALATGTGDKAVSLFYERRMHEVPSAAFASRCRKQIADGWAAIEASLSSQGDVGPVGHGEIAIACVWRFQREALPDLDFTSSCPGVVALSDRLEAGEDFRAIYQPFIAPS